MRSKGKKAGIFMLAASVLAGSVPCEMPVQAAEVGNEALADNGTAAPEDWGAVPSANQYQYQKEELAAFCHFGPNTFNEVEWGESYGNRTPDEIFTLEEDFDADTMVKTLKDAGFQKLIVTAKHHDGFCIWASAYTDYDVANTSYKNGQGDILAEISEACTKYDMNMGLYLSPWDIHEPSYGYYDENRRPTTADKDVLDYNDYYNNQLEEILGNPKYGNDGHFNEVWMDGAKGSGANAQEYDFQRWFATIQRNEGIEGGFDSDCMLFGAEAYTTVRWIGNELGLANEETWSKSRADVEKNTMDSNRTGENRTTVGYPDGNQWTVPEADARITSGWFWGNGKKTPKSISELANMYFNSVGHNATFLLNVPPNNQGKVDQAILDRVTEFGNEVKGTFATNLAANATVTATEVRGNDLAFSPENVIDGADDTYWTMEDGTTTGSLTLDLGGTKTFDVVTIEEAIEKGQRISSFTVEYKAGDGEWKEFASGTTIGGKRICRNAKVKANQVRINITGSYAVPLINEVGVYKATEGFEVGSSIPDGLEQVSVTDTDVSDGVGFIYTKGNGNNGWQSESGPQFISGNGIWANGGKELTLKFHGTKVWLYGTKDPSHGNAKIYIDDELAATISTQASPRATGQILFESGELSDGDHTLRVENIGTIGLDTAAILNNGGRGIVEFEKKTITMEEDSTVQATLRRTGGSTGEVSVVYENNPGSAVQGNYDVDGIKGTVVFQDGETEKTIDIRTKRDDFVKGDLDFTVDLIDATDGAILGSNQTLKVVIRDLDDPARVEEAKSTLAEAKELLKNASAGADIAEVKKAVRELESYLEASKVTDKIATSDIVKAAIRLGQAREGLSFKFAMPVGSEVKSVEAEAFVLDASGVVNANQYVRVQDNDKASGGKEVNWFENGNRIYLPFTAEKAGTYKVTATYRSGRNESNPNAFVWSGTHITAGSMDVYGEDGATTFHTAEMNIEITAAGDGELVFTATSKGGPVIDKFEIEPTDKTPIPAVAVTGVTLDKEKLALDASHPFEMIYETVLPANAGNQDVTFESSDEKVATVTNQGFVMGVGTGEAVITVTTADGKKTAQCKVSVDFTVPVEGVTMQSTEVTLTKEKPSATLQVTVIPANATNKGVIFTSSNPKAATVDANGVVKAVANGETVITAATADGNKTAQCKVTVNLGKDTVDEELIEIGKTYTDEKGYFYYKVTNLSAQTVTVTGLKKKELKSFKIYNTVKLGGKEFKVTAIAPSAFKKSKAVTSVTIGKHVETIGKNAFSGCKKLKKVTVNSTKLKKIDSSAFASCKKLSSITIKSKALKKVGKNAFKGTAKKLKIKVPAAKYKKYAKLLAKKGQGKAAKIVK